MKVKLTVMALLVVGLVLGLSGSAFANIAVTAPAQIAASVDVPNATAEKAILTFTLTSAGVENVTELAFIEGANAAFNAITAADAISDLVVYEDGAVVGTFEETDTAIAGTYDAVAMTYTFDAAEAFADTDTKDYIVVVELSGAAETDDVIAIDLDASASTTDGVFDVDAVGNGHTAVALELVSVVTKDVTGPPYNRPNGYLDSILLTFDMAVDDDTVDPASFIVGEVVLGAFTESFTKTFNADVEDDVKIYIQIDESVITDQTPNVEYTGATRILSADGLYGYPDTDMGAATDAAPPAPRSVTTLDTDNNGMLDMVAIQFSEDLTNGADDLGISVTGYTISGVAAVDPADGSDFAGVNSLWQLTIDEEDYDTGARPDYAYDGGINTLEDGTGLGVATFNQNNVPVTDGAVPRLITATTTDADDDGMFDQLVLDFSETVALAFGTVDDLEGNAGFDFNGIHADSYDFSATGHTIDGSQIIMMVNEIGSFDTAVLPVIEYNGAGLIVDAAPTPLALPDQEPYTNVASAADVIDVVPGDGLTKVFMQDGISARVTGGTWVDNDSNGMLDGVELVFSELMGTVGSTYTTFTIDGFEATGAVVAGTDVTVTIGEVAGIYNTGETPDVTYDGDTVVDANGALLDPIASDDINELDGAPPAIYAAETMDSDSDGMIDRIRLSFSEDLSDDNMTFVRPAGAAWGQWSAYLRDAGNGDDFAGNFAVAGYVVADVDANGGNFWSTGTVDYLELMLTESGGADTDATPAVSYTAGTGVEDVFDVNGLPLADFAGMATVDTAPPAAFTALTVDNDENGYVDGVDLTFSETITVNNSAVLAAFTMEELANVIDLSAATITKTGNNLLIVGTSSEIAETWDTGLTPALIVAEGNGIVDAVGNEMSDGNVSLDDGAAPVIGKALGYVAGPDIDIWFSEDVTNHLGAALDDGDIAYSGDHSITAINDMGDADGSTFTAVLDGNLDADNLRDDMLVIDDSGAIIDASSNVAPEQEVAISDLIIPTLLSASTCDYNQDGMIDNIKLVFSENIKNDLLVGHNDGANEDLVTIVQGTHARYDAIFDIEGFHVYGYNLTKDADDAYEATQKLSIASLYHPSDPPVVAVGEIDDDEIVHIMVKPLEKPWEFGDTEVTTTMTFTGGEPGASFSDFAENYVESVTDFPVDDGAPALIWDAWMTDADRGTILKVLFTEPLEDLTALGAPSATNTFTWLVGTEQVDYTNVGGSGITYLVNFRADDDIDGDPRLYTIEVNESNAVPSETNSTIIYAGGGILADAVGNLNAASIHDPIVVTPPVYGPIGVEEEEVVEVPEVYALSSNFPNPFNPTTTIDYDIAGDGGHVSLVIYNMAGQKVRTLVDEVKAPGFYSAVWDGTNERGESVASGIYIYKMVSGSFDKNERMTFIK